MILSVYESPGPSCLPFKWSSRSSSWSLTQHLVVKSTQKSLITIKMVVQFWRRGPVPLRNFRIFELYVQHTPLITHKVIVIFQDSFFYIFYTDLFITRSFYCIIKIHFLYHKVRIFKVKLYHLSSVDILEDFVSSLYWSRLSISTFSYLSSPTCV